MLTDVAISISALVDLVRIELLPTATLDRTSAGRVSASSWFDQRPGQPVYGQSRIFRVHSPERETKASAKRRVVTTGEHAVRIILIESGRKVLRVLWLELDWSGGEGERSKARYGRTKRESARKQPGPVLQCTATGIGGSPCRRSLSC